MLNPLQHTVKKIKHFLLELKETIFLKNPLLFSALFQTDMKKTRHPPTCSKSRQAIAARHVDAAPTVPLERFSFFFTLLLVYYRS